MKTYKALTVLICSLLVFTAILTGCARNDNRAVDMTVDGLTYEYSLKGVSTAENGNTVIEITMQPVKNSDGEMADLMTALNVGSMFLMETFVVVEGEEFDYNDNSVFAIDSDDNNDMSLVYKYEFSTENQPEKVFFYPSGKRNDSTYHWQIDPETGEILKEASITNEN